MGAAPDRRDRHRQPARGRGLVRRRLHRPMIDQKRGN
jgi:hypothetical protein